VNIKHKVLRSAVIYTLWYTCTGWCKKGRWPVSVRNVPSIYFTGLCSNICKVWWDY